MELLIGQKRRITIPKEIFEQSGLKEGDITNIIYADGKIIITKNTNENKTTNYMSVTPKQVKMEPGTNKTNKNTSSIQIVSNIQDKDKYVRSTISECGLVVRSKRKYINQFCEKCKGQLIKDKQNCKCIYNKNITNEPKLTKTLVNEIKVNTQKLENKLTTDIENFSENRVYFKGDTVIEPVKYSSGLQCCTNCEEYFTKGFLLNDDFYCKDCTKQNFLNYMKNRKERGN